MPTGKEHDRAHRIRRRLKNGTASDIDIAWLKQHTATVRPYAKGAPDFEPASVVAEVCRLYSVTGAELAGDRGDRNLQTARAVLVVSLRAARMSFRAIGELLGRGLEAAHHLYERNVKRAEVTKASRRIMNALSAPAFKDGDVVTFEVTVGSALWRMLDNMDEEFDLQSAVLERRARADAKAQRSGVE